MTEHTTIQITKAQAHELTERKTHPDESYKSVIARLLEGDNFAIDAEEVAREVSKQLDYTMLADEIAPKVAEELGNDPEDSGRE